MNIKGFWDNGNFVGKCPKCGGRVQANMPRAVACPADGRIFDLVEITYFDPGYTGTDHYWRQPTSGLQYVDSIKDFCEDHKAYWILDVVGTYLPQLKKYDFVVLFFDVCNKACTFYAREDTDEPDIVRQEIEFTDMDVAIKLYYENGVLCFPSDR